MMKKLYVIFLIVIGGIACNQEEELTPSNLDGKPLCEQVDLSKALIKKYKEQYEVYISYRFNDTLDYRFGIHDKTTVEHWNRLVIKKMEPEQVDFALEKLQEFVLQYFKEEVVFEGETIKTGMWDNFFPRHIFIVDSLAGEFKAISPYMVYLNEYESAQYFSFLWNGYEPMYAFNSKLLRDKSAVELRKYRNSMLFNTLCNLVIDRNLATSLPATFFEPVVQLYGTSLSELAEEEEAPTIEQRPGRPMWYAGKWLTGKGFAMTNVMFPSPRLYTYETKYDEIMTITSKLTFPGRNADIRNMLHMIVCETNPDKVKEYYIDDNDVFPARVRLLIRHLYHAGIDVFAINPAMELFFGEE